MTLFRLADDFLHGRARFSAEAPVQGRLGTLMAFVILGGGLYGVAMASFSGLSPGRWHQLIYVGVKVPALLIASFLLCLPSFFVINTVAGLREDFGRALQAVVATQSGVALVLLGMSPITLFFYLTTQDYVTALNFNGVAFAVASLAGQAVLRRYYQPLIRREARHRLMMRLWLGLYVFVAIQTAWVLRPFIGSPGLPVSFFREEKWGNAYVEVLHALLQLLGR